VDTLIPLVVAGVVRGSMYGILASGFTLIYNSTQVVNFAQGEFLMLGAMLMYALATAAGLPIFLSLVLALVGAILLGWFLKIGIVDPLMARRAPIINIIIATLAYGLVMSQGSGAVIGKNRYAVPSLIDGPTLAEGSLRLNSQGLTIIVVTIAVTLGLWYFFSRTTTGLAIRAVGYNFDAARGLGLNVSRLIAVTFVLSAAVSAVAGAMIAPITGASAYMGLGYGVKGFAAAIVGGIGNPFAAVLGGILVGTIESLGSYYLSTAYGEALTYLALLITLMVRPTGLFAEEKA